MPLERRRPTHDEMVEFSRICFSRLLNPTHDQGRNVITHEPSRAVVYAMQEAGWLVWEVRPGVSRWRSPRGGRLVLLAGTRLNPNPNFLDCRGNRLTYRKAREYATAGGCGRGKC